MSINCQVIILAAGHGTRMGSDLPKVMHKIGNRPMLDMVVSNAKSATQDVILVHSRGLASYLNAHKDSCKFVLQETPLGTAHAVSCAGNLIDKDKIVVVIFGDNPFISPEIIVGMVEHVANTQSAAATLAFQREDPAEYGRIITDAKGNFVRIVEFKFASAAEKKITLCNSGIMVFAPGILARYIPECLSLKEGEKRELYLPDMIRVCKDNGEKVSYLLSQDSDSVIGVNTQEELAVANQILHKYYDR